MAKFKLGGNFLGPDQVVGDRHQAKLEARLRELQGLAADFAREMLELSMPVSHAFETVKWREKRIEFTQTFAHPFWPVVTHRNLSGQHLASAWSDRTTVTDKRTFPTTKEYNAALGNPRLFMDEIVVGVLPNTDLVTLYGFGRSNGLHRNPRLARQVDCDVKCEPTKLTDLAILATPEDMTAQDLPDRFVGRLMTAAQVARDTYSADLAATDNRTHGLYNPQFGYYDIQPLEQEARRLRLFE